MTTERRALLLDIDGTLLGPDGTLSPRTLAALQAAAAGGFEVLLVTGRSVPGTVPVHRKLGIPNPCVCFNGLIIYDPDGDEWLSVVHLPDEAVLPVIEWARTYATFFFVTTRDAYHSVSVDSTHQTRIVDLVGPVRTVASYDDLPRHDVVKVQCFCPSAGCSALSAAIDGAPWAGTLHQRRFPLQSLPDLADFPLEYLDVEPVSLGKAEAVRFVEMRFHIPPERVIAVGDQVNDLTMLRAAGTGVAMGQAPTELKEAADVVIGDNGADGLAIFVEGLLYG